MAIDSTVSSKKKNAPTSKTVFSVIFKYYHLKFEDHFIRRTNHLICLPTDSRSVSDDPFSDPFGDNSLFQNSLDSLVLVNYLINFSQFDEAVDADFVSLLTEDPPG